MYDMIPVHNILSELSIDLCFSSNIFWVNLVTYEGFSAAKNYICEIDFDS